MESYKAKTKTNDREFIIIGFAVIGIIFVIYSNIGDLSISTDLIQAIERIATGFYIVLFILNAFVESLKQNVPPPIDVYDAASMSVISPLSEKSIRLGSAPVKFPDFTRGKWKTNKPVFGLNNEY